VKIFDGVKFFRTGLLRQQLIEDIRFLLKLKDDPVDGKWDFKTIRRIEEIRKRVGA
jgi:hypothetical protein